MALVLGMNAKLYYEAGGYSPIGGGDDKADLTSGAGTVIDLARDVTQNLETAEADVTTRGNNGWRATAPTLKDGSVDFQIVWDTANAVFQDLIDAWLNASLVGMAVLDAVYSAETTPGAHDGTGTGLVTNFRITNFTRNEALEEALIVDVTAKPTYSDVEAAWLDRGGYV